jgi:hypothetical protein
VTNTEALRSVATEADNPRNPIQAPDGALKFGRIYERNVLDAEIFTLATPPRAARKLQHSTRPGETEEVEGMTNNQRARHKKHSLWQGRLAAGTGLAILMAATAFGQDVEKAKAEAPAHPIPTAPKKIFTPASVYASTGLRCKLYTSGAARPAGLDVYTDDDGYARFYAVRASADDAVKQLNLYCADSAGHSSSYIVDLTSDDTFAPRPLNLATERGIDRPALKRDPLSYTQAELLKAGYGLRPDPKKDSKAYSRWLKAASIPGRMLDGKRPTSTRSNTVYTAEATP